MLTRKCTFLSLTSPYFSSRFVPACHFHNACHHCMEHFYTLNVILTFWTVWSVGAHVSMFLMMFGKWRLDLTMLIKHTVHTKAVSYWLNMPFGNIHWAAVAHCLFWTSWSLFTTEVLLLNYLWDLICDFWICYLLSSCLTFAYIAVQSLPTTYLSVFALETLHLAPGFGWKWRVLFYVVILD